MKRLRRLLASLLMIAIVSSPAGGFAAEGLFFVPAGIREIESEAFSDIPMPNGVFIPDSCTSIAPDAFSNPETLEIYGFTGSEAERYAADAGAVFHSVEIKNASVLGPVWASPDRNVTFTANYEGPEDTKVSFQISKEENVVFASDPSDETSFTYAFYDGGEYEVCAVFESPYETVIAYLPAPIKVAERILTSDEIFYLEVGESANLISSEETRTVSLFAPDSGLSVFETTVTGNELGKYVVTASAQTDEGVVYTDIPVEVIISAKSVTVTAERDHVLEKHSIQLNASVYPENATYTNVSWSVDSPEIASISDDGVLTGLKKGTVTVFATSGDVMDAVEIRVEKAVSAFEIAADNIPETLYTGMRFALSANAVPEDAYNPTCAYKSLTPEICAVDAFTGEVICLQAGEGKILATANDLGGASAEFTFTVLEGVSEIAFNALPDVLSAGETFQIEYTSLPETAYDKTVWFESSDETIASVSESGLITAVAPGNATISVRAANGFTAIVPVKVLTPVSSVKSALSTLYLNPGMTANPIGNFVFVQPENATYPSLTWSSDNISVALVHQTTGLITAVNNGTCRITGVSQGGKTVSFAVKVVSDARVVQKIAVSSTYGALNVGNTAVLTPSATPSNKYTSGTWYSSNPEVLEIASVGSSNKATIRAVSPGEATIYAIASSGITAKCTVVVNPIVVTDLHLNASSISLNVSDSFPLGAVFEPENATATLLTWTSSHEDVATVNQNGLVHALKGGTTVITATTEDGVNASCRVTVNTILMTGAKLPAENISVLAGDSGTIAYTVTPENATPAGFFWQSSDINVVSVHATSGKMNYLKAGSAVITGNALDGSGITLTLHVEVREVPITSFTANAESVTLLPGESFALFTRVLPIGASCAQPAFASSDEKIAYVSPDGVITAVSKGQATITAQVGQGDYIHTLEIPVTVEKVNDVTYRALIMGQFTVPATDGYLPFSNNSTKGFTDAISRSAIDGNRYEVTRIAGSPSPGAIRNAISRLSNQADENDVTVIFFLTHGTNTGSEGYQMQTNSRVVIESIDMINALKEISGHVVFVLCTCHSGRILSTSGAKALAAAGGNYVGKNGKGRLSILCSSTSTNSSYYRVNDEKLSYDFYTRSVTLGLGWDMLGDSATNTLLADKNGDNKVTVSELAAYSRGATQRGISAFIQQYGKDDFSGHAAQFPSWQIASGDEDLVIFQR